MITCMKMKSFILKYASKIMFYDVNIACYHATGHTRPRGKAARAHVVRKWRAGAHRWRGRVAGATRVHTDARVVPCGRGASR